MTLAIPKIVKFEYGVGTVPTDSEPRPAMSSHFVGYLGFASLALWTTPETQNYPSVYLFFEQS